MSLRAHLCSLGLNYGPWDTFMLHGDQVCAPPMSACPPPMSARPFLCVRALSSFKPLETHICPLGAHLCSLGLNYGP